MAEEMTYTGYDPTETEVADNTRLYVAMTRKADGFRLAATEEEYNALDKDGHTVEGIIIRNEEDEVDLLVGLVEDSRFFGEGPEDIPETDKRRKHYTSPSMIYMDGQWRTRFLLSEQGVEHEDDCALCYCDGLGMWLGSGGEMGLVRKYLTEVNALMELVGGTRLTEDGTYWLSTQYSKDYAWFISMEDGTYGFWLSKTRSLLVRPVGSAGEYQTTVTTNE